jgi:hypothetical protein
MVPCEYHVNPVANVGTAELVIRESLSFDAPLLHGEDTGTENFQVSSLRQRFSNGSVIDDGGSISNLIKNADTYFY